MISLCQTLPAAPGGARMIVVFRNQAISPALLQMQGIHVKEEIPQWGIAVIEEPQPYTIAQRLVADPSVAYVVPDRVIQASRIAIATNQQEVGKNASSPDWYYTSTPQAWAVKQVGGYGAAIPGAPAHGPWDISMGRGVRIAVLDSGISSTHPDTAPNLVFAESFVDQAAVPSPCDDSSAEDQDGHGTFVASLAAGAIGHNTGMVVGVAPQASLLNIKVLQRTPASGSGTTASLCEQGTASGLLSWLIEGIAAASARHADIISISAGALLDSYSGEAEGTIALINRAVYNATQAGALVIAAAGNNGESLDNNRYIEMPAQALDALAVIATTNPQCAQDLNSGATCQSGPVTVPYYSNFGTTLQAVAAPGGSYPEDLSGVGISGFVRGACSTGLPNTQDGLPGQHGHSFGCFNLGHQQYVEAIGTSASAPLVAGVAALLKGAAPSLTPAQIANALRASAIPRPQTGSGTVINLVNAAAALGMVQ